MKLELKHLCSYLPYGLKAKNCFNEIVEIKGLQYGNDSCSNELWTFIKNKEYLQGYLYQCQPILRPLSDLTKEIEHNGSIFIPAQWFGRIDINLTNPLNNRYEIVRRFIEWHFDVFSLIEKGLAIDINTLNK